MTVGRTYRGFTIHENWENNHCTVFGADSKVIGEYSSWDQTTRIIDDLIDREKRTAKLKSIEQTYEAVPFEKFWQVLTYAGNSGMGLGEAKDAYESYKDSLLVAKAEAYSKL